MLTANVSIERAVHTHSVILFVALTDRLNFASCKFSTLLQQYKLDDRIVSISLGYAVPLALTYV